MSRHIDAADQRMHAYLQKSVAFFAAVSPAAYTAIGCAYGDYRRAIREAVGVRVKADAIREASHQPSGQRR